MSQDIVAANRLRCTRLRASHARAIRAGDFSSIPDPPLREGALPDLLGETPYLSIYSYLRIGLLLSRGIYKKSQIGQDWKVELRIPFRSFLQAYACATHRFATRFPLAAESSSSPLELWRIRKIARSDERKRTRFLRPESGIINYRAWQPSFFYFSIFLFFPSSPFFLKTCFSSHLWRSAGGARNVKGGIVLAYRESFVDAT